MNVVQALRQRWAVVTDSVSTRLWPVPVVAVVAAVAAGVGLPRLDNRIDDNLPNWVTQYLFSGGADAARSLLGTIAGSLTTVTSLTFSLTVVTLQLASSQFSPRLLRTFTNDAFVQNTLALFLGTFAYALTVLRTVRGSNGNQLVPQISVTVAFVLAVASVLGLVLFLSHLVQEIRVETMIAKVHQDASRTLRTMFPERQPGQETERPAAPPEHAVALLVAQSGFLTSFSSHDLIDLACELDVVVAVDTPIGSSLSAGTPVGLAWSRSGALSLDAGQRDRLQECLADALLVGPERTAAQDISYGLRQLTDVANKALSPGINDPTTAVYTLGHSAAFLCEASRQQLGPRVLHDQDGRVRVVLAAERLADLLELAVAQPRRYGAADPDVLARLLLLLKEVAWTVDRAEDRDAVGDQLQRLRRTVDQQDFDSTELDRMSGLAVGVERALNGDWTP